MAAEVDHGAGDRASVDRSVGGKGAGQQRGGEPQQELTGPLADPRLPAATEQQRRSDDAQAGQAERAEIALHFSLGAQVEDRDAGLAPSDEITVRLPAPRSCARPANATT